MSNSFLLSLQSQFDTSFITRSEFRAFVNISLSTDWRMFKAHRYPRLVRIGGQDKILLIDLAKWLENGGSVGSSPKKRGRPIGSRNKNTNHNFYLDSH